MDLGIHRRIFKCQSRIDQLTVFHHQIINIAHTLQTLDGTVYQCQVFCIPSQVFSGDKGIIHGYIITVPECIFGQHCCIVHFHIFYTVEGIISHQTEVFQHQILAVHAEIIAFCIHMIQFHVLTAPQGLCRIREGHIDQFQSVTPAEILRCFDHCIVHFDPVGIPHTCACHIKPGTVLCLDVFRIPQRIFPLEHTSV